MPWRRRLQFSNLTDKETAIKSIAFISGPALGHLGRLYQVAKRLSQRSDVNITFYIPSLSKEPEIVLGDEFEFIRIPVAEETPHYFYSGFATRLEKCLAERKFDLIIHDGCPLRWTSVLRFPDCPRILITNVFLTKYAASDTVQSRWFKTIGAKINTVRARKNMAPLKSSFELYDADQVLLSDPERLFPGLDIPDHFSFCGPLFWSASKAIPKPLKAVDRFTLISMGSTGKRKIDDGFLAQIRALTGSQKLVYAGHNAPQMRRLKEIDLAFKFLPLNRIMDRVDAVVTQGGSGSSYQALSFGAPVIAFPTYLNQQILGHVLEKANLGLCIDLDRPIGNIDRARFDQIRHNAQKFSQSFRPHKNAGRAVRVIAQYL